MNADEMNQHWQTKSQDTFGEIARWRKQHPKAILAEIEQAVDEHLSKLRAQVIQAAAQSDAYTTETADKSPRLPCPKRGTLIYPRGRHYPHISQKDSSPVSENVHLIRLTPERKVEGIEPSRHSLKMPSHKSKS